MGLISSALFYVFEKYRLFIGLALVIGFLTPFYGLFIVDATTYNTIILRFSDFFASLEGLICILPLVVGFGCLILYWIAEVSKHIVKQGLLSEIPSHKLLAVAFILITTSIISLYLAFPAGNPHEFLIRRENFYSECACIPTTPFWGEQGNAFWWNPGNPFWWTYYDSGVSYALEIVNFNLNIGFILGSLIPIFTLCDIISQRILLRHYYTKYLPEIRGKNSCIKN
jgi:hypothetical protein